MIAVGIGDVGDPLTPWLNGWRGQQRYLVLAQIGDGSIQLINGQAQINRGAAIRGVGSAGEGVALGPAAEAGAGQR